MQALQLVAEHPLAIAALSLALAALLASAYFASTRAWLRRFDELPERRFLSAAERAVLCWPARLDEEGLARAQRFHRWSSRAALALLALVVLGLAARRVVRSAESPRAVVERAALERVTELCSELERELAEADGSSLSGRLSSARAAALAERLERAASELEALARAGAAEPEVQVLLRRAALALAGAREQHEEVLLLAGERELELAARATEEQIERELALLLARARALRGLDRAPRALELYERALALRPERAHLRLVLAELEVALRGAPPPTPQARAAQVLEAAPAVAPPRGGAPADPPADRVVPAPAHAPGSAEPGAPQPLEQPLADAPAQGHEPPSIDPGGERALSGAQLLVRLETLRARGAPRAAADAAGVLLAEGDSPGDRAAGDPAQEGARALRASLHHLRARCRLELSELELALEDCDAALNLLGSVGEAEAALDEQRALVLQTRGRVQARAARHALAEADFDAAISLWRELARAIGREFRPSLARALADRGRAAFNRHDLARARLDLDEALEILALWVEHEGGVELASELDALRRERALALGGERGR